MRVRGMALAALALGVAGCIGASTVDNSKQASAIVMGQVLKPDGVTPIGGPIVVAQLLGPAVNGVSQLLSQGSYVGDDNGRFLFLFLMNGVDPQNGTVNLSVTAPIASGFLSKDTLSIPVRIANGWTPTDTTYVQIKLQAR